VPRDRAIELDETVAAPEGRDPALDATVSAGDPALDATLLPGPLAGQAAADAPGSSAGRYRVGGEVGRGGLGRVVSAHDLLLDRTVALKELLDDSEDSRRRFQREVLITARLQHPSIVPIYDAGQWPTHAPFYAMKLVGGRPLSDAIAAAPSLEQRLTLLPNVLAVADAIAFAHGERIIHRDLKPHNVLVGPHGETMVIDWGIAKDLGSSDEDAPGIDAPVATRAHETVAGSTLGTPGYMAPEQALGGKVDERSDVYALGAMLYHVLSGTAPHEGDTLQAMLTRIGRGEITPLAEREPRAPAELRAIVTKAMARRPSDRYPTARDVADDLRRYTTDQLVFAYRYTLWHRLRRWVQRNAAASVALVLLAAFGAWTLWSLRRERRDAFDAARLELELAVAGTGRDVAFSLDQAEPMLVSLRALTDPALPLATAAPRMHDLAVGRPGVANISIGFASGVFRGTFIPAGHDEIQVQESMVGEGGTLRHNYRIAAVGLVPLGELHTDYDVRLRPHYALAERTRERAWMPPRTYFTSRTTGITCVEPVYGPDGALSAVTTVDFDVAALSAFVVHPPLPGARAVVFAGDGSILAFPSASLPDLAVKEGRVLRHEDFADPVLDAMFAELGPKLALAVRFLDLRVEGEDYLVAVAPIGGRRAGVVAPLDWYVATMVPAKGLVGSALARERQARVALVAALAIAAAMGVWFVRWAVRARANARPRA
jgi:tRNA A-37 threonylcarbamoyl transferase component Bud32